ncbi:MAG: multicopper oxidase domain-containing protein [Vitreoscilla sp.]|nr:multicopper oxidase domain-containing protein [Vitreoscilla sp.]
MESTNTFFSGATARARLWLLAAISATAFGAAAPAAAQTAQTITFNALANKVAGDADFSVSAAADSGLPVSFAAAGDCTVNLDQVHLLTPATLRGACTITASQAGDSFYSPAADVAQSFTISAASTYSGGDLYAVAGSVTLPGLTGTVPVLGYDTSSGAVASQPGGPTLVFNQGDTVTITLHNELSVPTGLLFQGQALPPDTAGVPPGATKTYSFVASQPGTYLYEAAPLPNAQYQAAMGLHGALVILPTTSGQAYADPATAYDREAVLVLSEIDPALNSRYNATTPTVAQFDMRSFAPRYFLISGKVYPNTDPIPGLAGNKLLLRYVNAGAKHHSMAALGLRQNFVAKDGSLLPTASHNVTAETLAPGQTGDAVATIPAAAVDGSRFAVYDGSLLMVRNSNQAGFGGMMTFVTVAGTPSTADTQGPATSALTVSAAGLVTATVSDEGLGGSTISAAEYFVDTVGANGSGLPMEGEGNFGSATSLNVSAALATPYLSGSHTVYVHGQDSAGNWGALQAKLISFDATGPVTSALALSPGLTNGTVNVALNATANDTATGGSNIGAAEYRVNDGLSVPMALSTTGAKVSSITAAIPAATVNALTEGTHVINVRSQDTATPPNWGAWATTNLVVNKTGATTSSVLASPNPNNGARALSASQPVVRVTAQVSSLRVVAAEGFIDTVGAIGSGFPFSPMDGAFGGATETVFADIPLSTVNSLANGLHTIHVRGKDGGGSWGGTSTTTLLIDKLAPALSVTPATSTIAAGSATAALSVTATDANAITTRQYWVDGTATPPASPQSFTGNSISLASLPGGTHTVYVRVRDEATNWSNVASATVTVVQAVNDTRSITAGTGATQGINTSAANGLLANDQPLGLATRSVTLASAPSRTSGTGTGTLTLSCQGGTAGTAATPAIGVQTICTNGAYRMTLNGVGVNGAARQASKRGTFSFTYTETLNGVTSPPATVTITVN